MCDSTALLRALHASWHDDDEDDEYDDEYTEPSRDELMNSVGELTSLLNKAEIKIKELEKENTDRALDQYRLRQQIRKETRDPCRCRFQPCVHDGH